MEQIKLDEQSISASPVRRNEVYVPFKKFVLASDFGIPSRDPTTGAAGGAQLFWDVLYDGDPNGYIGLGLGYITLNLEGVYLVMCRVTMRPDTDANTQRLTYMELNLDSSAFGAYGAYSDGDVHRLTVNGNATSSLFLDESSLGAGDSKGTSLYTQCLLPVIQFTEVAPPRYVSASVYQQSDSLQGQNLTPRDQDIWLQVVYLGTVDQRMDRETFRYL